jgi:hypothetical protein
VLIVLKSECLKLQNTQGLPRPVMGSLQLFTLSQSITKFRGNSYGRNAAKFLDPFLDKLLFNF